jgi:hypothetical protein
MSCLSVFREGLFVGCANPIFTTSAVALTPGESLTFEVFAADAAALKARLGQAERYMLDSSAPFFAQLTKLEPCENTHFALSLLRDKATLRGVLAILPEQPITQSIQ